MWERKLYYMGRSHYNYQNKALVRWAWLYSQEAEPGAQSHQGWLALTQPRAKHTWVMLFQALSRERWGRLAVWDLPPMQTGWTWCTWQRNIPHFPSPKQVSLHNSSAWSQCGTSTWPKLAFSLKKLKIVPVLPSEEDFRHQESEDFTPEIFLIQIRQFFIYFQRFLLSFVCW